MPNDWIPAIITTFGLIIAYTVSRSIDWIRHRPQDEAELEATRAKTQLDYGQMAFDAWSQVRQLATRLTTLEDELTERDQTIARQAIRISQQAERITQLEAEVARLKLELIKAASGGVMPPEPPPANANPNGTGGVQ